MEHRLSHLRPSSLNCGPEPREQRVLTNEKFMNFPCRPLAEDFVNRQSSLFFRSNENEFCLSLCCTAVAIVKQNARVGAFGGKLVCRAACCFSKTFFFFLFF